MKISDEDMSFSDSYIGFMRKRITDLRIAKGVSEHAMSLALGRNGSYIRQITKPDGAVPTLESLMDICEYFEISVSDFFDIHNQSPIVINAIAKELNKYSAESLERLLKLIKNTEPEALDVLLGIIYKTNDSK